MPSSKRQKTKELSHRAKKKLRNKIWAYLKDPSYIPVSELDLANSLKIKKNELGVYREILSDFHAKDMIYFRKKLLYPKIHRENKQIGTFSMNPRGFGFVLIKSTEMEDVFIPKHLTLNAIDGDEVEVLIFEKSKKDKGPEGKITEIIKRAKQTIVGTIQEHDGQIIIAYCPVLANSNTIHVTPSKKFPLKIGDRVLLSVKNWDSYPDHLVGSVQKNLGNIEDPKSDIQAAIFQFGLLNTFSKEVLNEIKQFPINPTAKDLKGRADLTNLETFTIDPDTAKDFDDALSLYIDKKGNYELAVHIADVSFYVKQDSELDKAAKARCNSTYFPGTCLPMLPEKLSNGLCSLKENVIRLTVTVFMDFDKKGNLISYDVQRSFIKSQKRMTYKEAKKVLDGQLDSPHKKTLKLMEKLCKLLQKKRRSRGSIDFSIPEIVIKLDENDEPTGHEVIEYDITHQIVEEFMLKANEIIATHLFEENIPSLFRVHEQPSTETLEVFYNLARGLGFDLPKDPTKKQLQKLFTQAKTTPYLYRLYVSFIRSMKLAIYSENNVGHYGLCLDHYTHFTSPIRRYSDLVIHRLLFEKPPSESEIKKIGSILSEKERISFKAETNVVQIKKLRLIHKKYLADETEYQAVISKVKPHGVYFELLPLLLEGFIPISELGNEYFRFDEKSSTLIGTRTNTLFKLGEKIDVNLININLITRKTSFELVRNRKKKNST